MALGAFLAGMLISETEYRYQVGEDIKPFRDVLLGLFFVTVGMFLDVGTVGISPRCSGCCLPTDAQVRGGRGSIARVRATRHGYALWSVALCWRRVRLRADFSIDGLNLLPPAVMQVTVASLVLSMLLAPLIVRPVTIGDALRRIGVAARSMELTKVAAKSMAPKATSSSLRYGRSGQYMARFIERENVDYGPGS